MAGGGVRSHQCPNAVENGANSGISVPGAWSAELYFRGIFRSKPKIAPVIAIVVGASDAKAQSARKAKRPRYPPQGPVMSVG